ncbi:MAG: HD domain-containing protein [Treponemataceae bacterium]|nr:HD domain-containing protein [Treponemataceae bacterium]
MNSYPISELEDGTTFSSHVFLDEQFQLLDTEVPFSGPMKKALIEWNFRAVLSDGKPKPPEKKPESSPAASDAKKDIPQDVTYEAVDLEDLLGLPHVEQEQPPEPLTDVPDLPTEDTPIALDDLDDMFDNLDAPPELDGDTAPLAENSAADGEESGAEAPSEMPAPGTEADDEQLAQTRAFYNNFLNDIDMLFKQYTVEKTLAAQAVAEKITELCAYLKEHQQYVLRIMPTDEASGKHFLVNHSMRSTVLALIIGMTLRLPADKLTELGTACLLHEIGQIRLPPQLYMTKGPLSPEERDKMAVHPILSYNILKENDFSLPVQIAALEHHEREDGSGYPRKLTGEHITAFAKIIAAACSFEAITAPRHFREARTAYEAMLDMLKEHEPQYDKIVLKALVHSLSLFPIGAFVCLANGKTAQVIKNTPGNPTHPAVKLTDGTGEHETDDGDYKIVRVLNAQEAESLKNDAE